MLLGVRPAYRTTKFAGFALLLLAETHVRGAARGYEWAELSWVLEDNHMLNASLAKLPGYVYKRYRIYEKPLAV